MDEKLITSTIKLAVTESVAPLSREIGEVKTNQETIKSGVDKLTQTMNENVVPEIAKHSQRLHQLERRTSSSQMPAVATHAPPKPSSDPSHGNGVSIKLDRKTVVWIVAIAASGGSAATLTKLLGAW